MDAIKEVGQAEAAGKLLENSAEALRQWLGAGLPSWAQESLEELIEGGEWEELNNRFFQTIAFGTGGMRARTIGKVSAKAELGTVSAQETPEHAAVGAAMLNDFNVARATMGLYRYAARHVREKLGFAERPKLVIAHDVRHFSRHFSELAASVWQRLGGQAYLFDGPRSTPQLSFTVRHLGATCGIVITASHNPSHDNGYKVYFEDGGQVVPPHDKGIIGEVNKVGLDEVLALLQVDVSRTITLTPEVDAAYLEAAATVVVDPEAFEAGLRVVFTPIHGTGAVSSVPLLERFGVKVERVDEQEVMDPRFPTVDSPNPENAPALEMAIAKASACGADVVIATDPDADRMGVAVKGDDGELHLMSGNQIGSVLAEYRIDALQRLGKLPPKGTARAALIKTFVTTPLQAAIAERYGLKTIETLTGFKWIGEKLRLYEEELAETLRKNDGTVLAYDKLCDDARRRLLLEHSTYYVFGGEESYGYLASDRVRDKDANAAVLMFCEMASALKKQGKHPLWYLDDLYRLYGYHEESLVNIYYEGASGAAKIQAILKSYREEPPKEVGGIEVNSFRDFGREEINDADGKAIPKQDFYFLELANGYRYAVRGSGTEPKIKFYLFARENVAEGEELDVVKAKTRDALERLGEAIEKDAGERAQG